MPSCEVLPPLVCPLLRCLAGHLVAVCVSVCFFSPPGSLRRGGHFLARQGSPDALQYK